MQSFGVEIQTGGTAWSARPSIERAAFPNQISDSAPAGAILGPALSRTHRGLMRSLTSARKLVQTTFASRQAIRFGKHAVLISMLATTVGCVTSGPVSLNQPVSGEAVKLGRVHILRTDGTKLSLDAAVLKNDTIFGRERLGKGPKGEFRDVQIPIFNVRNVEREAASRTGTLILLAGLAVIALGAASFKPVAGP